jgi:plasmid stabilization system protein ParE
MLNVELTFRAEKDLEKILKYLSENWPEKVVINFDDSFELVVKQMRDMPNSFPNEIINKVTFKKARITKHNAIYFKIIPEKSLIKIITVHDTRQKNKHPKKLK